MQCSAWRPTSSASTSVRPLSSRTRWNSCGPSPGAHAGPERRVRVHPLGGRGARQQLQEDLEVAPLGQDLLDPHHGDEHLGQRRAHAPVALGLDDADRAGLGDAEVRAADRHRHRRGTSRAGARRAASASAVGSQPRSWPCGDRALEQRADLGAVAVDRRARGCATTRRRASWMISSARSVSIAWMPARGERLVEPDLVGGERLDLDHLARAVAPARCRRRSRSPRRRRAPSGRVPPARVTAASSRSSCSGSVAIARALIAAPGLAQRLPVGQLGDRAARAWRGSSSSPCRGCGAAGCRAASRAPRPGSPSFLRRQDLGEVHRRARRRAGAAARRRCASGTSCRPPCRPRRACRARARSLSESIAIEVSAFLTANVPPKPQHSCASGSSTRSMPAHGRAAAAAAGRRPAAAAASGRSGGRSPGAGTRRRRPRRRAGRRGTRSARTRDRATAGHVLAHHADARRRRRDDRLVVARTPARSARTSASPRRCIAGVAVHLPAAGLLLREVDLEPEPLEQLDHRAARGREPAGTRART